MNFQLFRVLGVLALSIVVAGFVGYAIAVQSYDLLILTAAGVVFLIAMLSPGYSLLLALGLLSPFSLPVPFIRGFPFLLLILGICVLKYSLQLWLTHRAEKTRPVLTWTLGLFFAWVLLRFCLKPTLPNLSGFGENVTGFRSYLNYALCFGIVWFLGRVIKTKDEVLQLMRRLAWISVVFIFILVPLMFTKSMSVALLLTALGAYVTTFDNGLFRFVVLPGFGLILITLALLPRLLPIHRYYRIGMFLIGMIAVVLGGNRSSALMMFAILCVIPLLKRRFVQFAAVIGMTGLCLGTFYIIGQNVNVRDFGLLRIMAVTSQRVAVETGAEHSVQWRKLRWNRAMEEIRNNPLIGRGYGGLENAFIWSDWSHYEDASIEIDVASGGIHNGYLACALALGIPAALFFIGIFGWHIFENARRALDVGDKDPFLSEVHIMVCASLAAFALTIYIGTDVNSPMIWFYFALGLVAARIGVVEVRKPALTKAAEDSTVRTPQTAGLPAPYRAIRLR